MPLNATLGSSGWEVSLDPAGGAVARVSGQDQVLNGMAWPARNSRNPRSMAGAREVLGTRQWSWSESAKLTHAGTTPTSTIADTSLGDTHVLRIPFSSGTRAGCKVALTAPVDLSARKVIRIVARNNGASSRVIQMRLGTTSGFTIASYFYLSVEPGINVFMVDTYSGSNQGGFTWPVNGAAVQHFWFVDIGSVESGYSNLQSGDSIDIGLVTTGAKSRPIFSFVTDDAKTGNLNKFTDWPTGYPASGGTHFDIISSYGFVGTTNIDIGEVNTVGFLTTEELRFLRAQGWDVIPNSHDPYTSLPLATVVAEINRQRAGIAALGFDVTDCWTPATGAVDSVVYAAYQQTGVRLIRLVTAQTSGAGIYRPNSHINGKPGGFYPNGAKLYDAKRNLCVVASSFQLDGGLSTADVDAYIQSLVDCGGIGSCYVHDVNAASATLLDYLCSVVRTKVNAGDMDVMTLSQVRDLYIAANEMHVMRHS